jgi:hypothetical protein
MANQQANSLCEGVIEPAITTITAWAMLWTALSQRHVKSF